MADRPSKTPKKEGTSELSVKKRSDIQENKSRSPIITRSRSRNEDDKTSTELNSAISRSSKRLKSSSEPISKDCSVENKVKGVVLENSQSQERKFRKRQHPKQQEREKEVGNNKKAKKIDSQAVASSSKSSPLASSEASTSKNTKNKGEKSSSKVETETRPKSNKKLLLNNSKKEVPPTRLKSKKAPQSESKNFKDNKRKPSATNRLVMDQNGSNFPNNLSANQNQNNNAPSNSESSGQVNPSTSAILSTYGLTSQTDLDDQESDMNRLQSILSERGLHQHFLSIPRMQNMFYRSFSSSSNNKAQQLLNAYNSATNDSEKLHYVLEMCQILLMGNEDTLVGFPIKSVVPTLINLLSMEHNFEIMHHACRALTYMMEALPRSSVVVLDAVPVFLEKLQVIQCMDVAEQSLSALEMLSRRHNKAILHARGVSACLTFLDFFSIDAQRSALTITANCFQNLSIDDFQYVQDSLPILSSHLTIEDKKCIESICLAFYRLVECYQNDCVIISEIASAELLTNIQNVLMNMPPILSTGSFVNVIRMLSIMCVSCSQIAVELLKLNICETLKCLLLCSENLEDKSDSMNLISRTPQEICELTSFMAELMPSLPLSGIFSVDVFFSKANTQSSDVFVWQWKNDRGLWEAFNPFDNKIIEQAHQIGEDELELNHINRTYILDFNSMQKICEDTGNTYAIQRKTNTFNNTELLSRANMETTDPRTEFFYKEHSSIKDFVKFVFKVLTEVYNNSAGYSVRYKCLNGILRIIYYAPTELLKSILVNQSISSSIATMLASHDIRVVVCAVQMCNILMEKMPDIFMVYFQREGVIHQIRQLYMDESRFNDNNNKNKDVLNSKMSNNGVMVHSNTPQSTIHPVMDSSTPMMFSRSTDSISSIEYVLPSHFATGSIPTNHTKANNPAGKLNATQTTDQTAGRHDENLKRKRTRKNTAFPSTTRPSITLENCPESTLAENDVNICSSLSTTYLNNLPLLVSETINGAQLSSIGAHKNSNRLSSSKDFLQKFNPTRWARWSQSTVNANPSVIPTTSNVPAKDVPLHRPTNTNKDAIKSWIKEQGKTFDEKYFVKSANQNERRANISPILADLNNAINLLKQDAAKGLSSIKDLLMNSDLSSFELIHSGLVKNLLSFLVSTDENAPEKRENHLRLFWHVFVGAPQSEMAENISDIGFERKTFSKLVNKLNACLSQLEQFPVRIQDYSAVTARGSHPLKFFSSNFLKISLNRHPSCTNLRKFKGPMIKLDPFTTVQSIERYLLARGYGKIKENDEESDDDDDLSDEDSLDLNLSSSSPTMGKHRLQLLIDEHVLPYDISIFQAIKQFKSGDLENESEESHLGNSKYWSATFYIFYRLGNESNASVSGSSSSSAVASASLPATIGSGSKSTSGSTTRRCKNKTCKKKDELWLEGKVTKSLSPLEQYLRKDLSFNISINEQTVEVISLLRVLYGINKFWGHLYKFSHIYKPLIPLKEFVNNKLTVKANRQLQDPVIIMTGTLPNWLSEIANACPFMFPFEVRYLLFYAVCFDRDRALQRLFENTPDLSSLDSRDRVLTFRIEKRKKIISRNDIFKSAESLFNDVSSSKSLLEIQYENEVGTGLGPTLEFYALVSKEFQRAELEMWRGEVVVNNIKNEKAENNSMNYVYSNYGLFPVPVGRNTKPSSFTKIRHRFKLLGKFMAKALMDSRMIDINLNILFYKWLLNEESTLSVSDLYHLDYAFYSSISQMYKIALRKMKMNVNNNPESFKLHGSSIEDLNLDFIMPGYPNIELRKGGKDLAVTLNNLENYIELVSHWTVMEGIVKQMEAFKEGFNSIFNLSNLKLFYPEELQQLFCGSNYKNWDFKMLMDSCKTDHGFTHESRAIKFLFEILSSYNDEEQRKFLQFLTGFPRLPIGGFKSLNPPFTIVKKNPTESDNPNCLPSVMTCVNYLKLPDYPTIEIMREKLKIAISEGQFSFHLS